MHTGKAEILSTVDDRGICAYECEIIKLYPQKEMSGKGMVIRITDRELIAKTGGIVQGMSGSPVMQDGKLIGAVTHVFVNDAKCGYCIYSWWMTVEELMFTDEIVCMDLFPGEDPREKIAIFELDYME